MKSLIQIQTVITTVFMHQFLIISCFALSLSMVCVHNAYAAPDEIERMSSRAQSEETARLWDDLHQGLKDLGDRWGKHNKLPDSSLMPFKKTKRSNKKKIDQLAIRLMEGVGSSPLDQVLKERRKLIKSMMAIQKEIVKLEEKAFNAPEKGGMFTKTRAKYEAKIKAKKEELDERRQSLNVLMIKIKKTFEEMGLKITQSQVNDLFIVITGDSMREFFVRFSNLKLLSEVIAHHISKSQSGQGYAGQAKRYYAIYVALVYMLREAHEKTIDKIVKQHIPRVEQLYKETKEQINQTESLMSQPGQEVNRVTYEQNLAIQKKLLHANQSYRKYLATQQEKLQKASTDLKLRFDGVLNTYRTISIAETLLTAIKSGVKDINDLQSLTLPEMLPLSNDKLHDEFKLVTGKLEGDDFQNWEKR